MTNEDLIEQYNITELTDTDTGEVYYRVPLEGTDGGLMFPVDELGTFDIAAELEKLRAQLTIIASAQSGHNPLEDK